MKSKQLLAFSGLSEQLVPQHGACDAHGIQQTSPLTGIPLHTLLVSPGMLKRAQSFSASALVGNLLLWVGCLGSRLRCLLI